MDIYNFITKHRKIFKIIFCLIVIFVCLESYIFRQTIFIDATPYFYIFSTIAQGFVALVAFLGAVIIFRLQLYENEMEKVSEAAKILLHSFSLPEERAAFSPVEIFGKCSYIINDLKTEHPQLRIVYNKMEEILKQKGRIRNQMVDFTIISFINISLALINLLFPTIYKIFPIVGYSMTIFNIGFSIFSLFFAWRVVRSAVGYTYTL
jgi:hypothetical protein